MFKYKSVYILGIGGISLSAIARLLKAQGVKVRGIDAVRSDMTDFLIEKGIDVKIGKGCADAVLESDCIIYTSAIADDNPDIILAREQGKPIMSRAEALALLSEDKKCISVAGSHGKTTTTGMIASILLKSDLDPTVHIGGILNNIDSNLYIGNGDFFVTEACEYKDSFLKLKNYISVILNVQEDHLDYFKNLDNIFASFNKFIENTSKNGVIIYNSDEKSEKLQVGSRKYLSFGIKEGAIVSAKHIIEYSKGKYQFDLYLLDQKLTEIKLPCFGFHNIYNALASSCVAIFLGLDGRQIKEGIEDFKGIKRRFEIIKEGAPIIIHDYAHHPTEILSTTKACREVVGEGKLVAIFQPHTFSRTRDLYDEFQSCFKYCDEVWMLPIYPAREKAIKGINSSNFAKDLIKNGVKSRYFDSFNACREEIMKNKTRAVMFAILGAGDIEKLAYSLK